MTKPLTFQFIRNYTVEPIGSALAESAKESNFSIELTYGSFDNLGTEILNIRISDNPPTFVVLTIDLDYFCGGIYSPNWKRSQVVDEFNQLLNAVDTIPPGSFILISNFIPSTEISIPLSPGHDILGRSSIIDDLNLTLRDFIARRTSRFGLLDFARLAVHLGEASTKDRRFALMYKSPFKENFVAAAAQEILRFIKCKFTLPKKVLILDCDNTMWGGVIGEVGLDNIQLDPYEYPGIAYYRFQFEVLSLIQKGFLVCLCSKNDEALVWDALENHPYCLIRRNHIIGHRVNWIDKATNIRNLAEELNLGLDSIVFVDDNPGECDLVRARLPEVTVIQVPSRIYDYPGILERSQLFDRISVNDDDKERGSYYQAESKRRELQSGHNDLEGFLRDLNMKAVVRELEASDLPRASQLCQRTNQFNLTTKRYTDSELAGLMRSDDCKLFVLEAEDRYGPMGMTGLIIYTKLADAIEIDTFLLSCRIIGRQFDRALFRRSLDLVLSSWPHKEIRSSFIPSAKNSVVVDLWQDYGFTASSSNDSTEYVCPSATLAVNIPLFIEVS
jgi:FkbH-like protein